METFKHKSSCLLFLFFYSFGISQAWQQRVNYTIYASLNDTTKRIGGYEKITYINNSPDTLDKVFLHLYWNAFQPNSSMDIHSQQLKDPDKRVMDRISKLHDTDQGYQKIKSIYVNKIKIEFENLESIAKLILNKPIAPNSTTIIEIEFEAQVPKQIRRSGKNNAEGIMYSMSQWYPKICAYDARGWHANQYIGREFYGEWGDFDVHISANKKFIIAATGEEINAKNITVNNFFKEVSTDKKVWHFYAPKVHDFVWAADSTYVHDVKNITNEKLKLHFYYKKNDSTLRAWQDMQVQMQELYPIIKNLLGDYPYPQYSFIQGGDGGMEYPMATLIKSASLSTAIHEWAHAWFQGMLANNESDFAWLDEGFANYMEHKLSIALQKKAPTNLTSEVNFYIKKVNAKENEEPMNFLSDHFSSNGNYFLASYTKGALLLQQLEYLIGENKTKEVLKMYVNKWKFKHPQPNDFFKIVEDVSKMQLKWFQAYWTNSSKNIDYAIKNVTPKDGNYAVKLERLGALPMPIEATIIFDDGSEETHFIPLDLMLGNKKEFANTIVLQPIWKWVQPFYDFNIITKKKLKKIVIDKSQKMVDINLSNNVWEQ